MYKTVFLLLVLATQAHGADYFYCKQGSPNFPDDHMLVTNSGITFYRKHQAVFSRTFIRENIDVLRMNAWKENLSDKASIMAKHVPSSYGEPFEVIFRQLYDAGASHTKLVCKRVYRFIGRP